MIVLKLFQQHIFAVDFHLTNFESGNATFTLSKLCKKFKEVSYTSTKMNNIAVFSARSRFPVKKTCCVAFGSVSSSFRSASKPFTLLDDGRSLSQIITSLNDLL